MSIKVSSSAQLFDLLVDEGFRMFFDRVNGFTEPACIRRAREEIFRLIHLFFGGYIDMDVSIMEQCFDRFDKIQVKFIAWI